MTLSVWAFSCLSWWTHIVFLKFHSSLKNPSYILFSYSLIIQTYFYCSIRNKLSKLSTTHILFSFSNKLSALRRLRASNQVEEDIEEMRAEERAQQSESSISTIELICSPTLRAPLIIGIVMQLSQQFSGINAVSFPHNYYQCLINSVQNLKHPTPWITILFFSLSRG